MSKKKTPIDFKVIDRINTLMKIEKLSQKELSKRINCTSENINRIIKGKHGLTMDMANQIINAFPEYRIEWLLGYDDCRTHNEYIEKCMKESDHYQRTLKDCILELIKNNGIDFKLDQNISKADLEVLNNPDSDPILFDKTWNKIDNAGYIFQNKNTNRYVRLSISELESFSKEISDYIAFRLDHMMNDALAVVSFKNRSPEEISKHLDNITMNQINQKSDE